MLRQNGLFILQQMSLGEDPQVERKGGFMKMKNIKSYRTYQLMVLMPILLFALLSSSWAESAANRDIFGDIKADTYENSFIGYGCKLPGWYFYTEDEIAALYQLSKEAYNQEIGDMIEASQNIIVMFAEDASGKNNISIQVQYAKQYIPIYSLMGIEGLIDQLVDQLAEVYNSAGLTVLSTEKVKTTIGKEQYPGLKISYIKDGETVFTEETAFIRDDYMVYISATSFGEDGTSNSLSHFYPLNSTSAINEEQGSEEKKYTDAETGAEFIVPMGWQEKELSKERETVKSKFVNKNDGLAVILFASSDMAKRLSNDENEIALARILYNMDMLDKETIASIAGVPSDGIQMAKFGTNDYFVVDRDSALGSKSRLAIMVKNGRYIMFTLQAFSLDSYSSDFESMLSSVILR